MSDSFFGGRLRVENSILVPLPTATAQPTTQSVNTTRQPRSNNDASDTCSTAFSEEDSVVMIVDDSIVFFLEASFETVIESSLRLFIEDSAVIAVEDLIVSPTPRVGDRRMDRSGDVS